MGKKILLADDSITIQKVIELTFSDEDFDVVTVGNGRLAVEKVQEVRPDVVLCDIIMPEKDGYEVCDFIKRNASLSHIPVLLLTGAFEPFDQERAARVGCDGFLAKPFEPETLIAKVKDLLKKAASRTVSSAGLRTPPVVAEPFPVPPREPEPSPPATSSFPPGPPARPPELIPFPTAAVRPPGIEPPPAPPSPPEVRFIPDEPFGDLDGATFAPDTATASFGAPPVERRTFPVAEEAAATRDLLPMTPEESESLAAPAAPSDSANTVMFKAGAVSWSAPLAEPPTAAAPPPSPPAAAEPEFEEVVDEDVVGFPGAFGASPAPAAFEPPAAAPPPPPAAPPALATSAPEPRMISGAGSVPGPTGPRAPAPPWAAAEAAPSFADVAGDEVLAVNTAAVAASVAAEVAVPVDMVAQIAQRVVAQISERVVAQIAWEVIPDLAEAMLKKEIERLKAELQRT
ncbi:MAG TPA: response regulator [Vicinamibacteria bacterium]|nr:response regulator [Vicinamibacteria bacterium]